MFTEMLIAYDEDGNIIQTLDYLVQQRPDGKKRLVDFARIEERGGAFDSERAAGGVWHVPGAVGAKVWPERLASPQDFRIEKEGKSGKRRLKALVHKKSGFRRERADIEQRLAARMEEITRIAGGEARMSLQEYLTSIADIVGLPNEPLETTSTGRTKRAPKAGLPRKRGRATRKS